MNHAFDLVLIGGNVVRPDGIHRADVGIRDGRFAAFGDLRTAATAESVDVSGLTLLPGLIDTQVHFREPGMEHKEDIESGTRAAVFGGVTSIFEMPNTAPPTTTAMALNDKLLRAKGRAWCDYGFFVGASPDNVGQLAELEKAPGSPGVKIFMGSSTGTLLVPDDETLRQVLMAGERRAPVHSEDHMRLEALKGSIESPTVMDHPRLRDPETAVRATRRLLRLARETGRPVHVLHISTEEELALIEESRGDSGVDATWEVTPQHLYFSAPDCYERLGTLAQMNPPIRDARHQMALREAVRRGLFDVFGSDHAPHTLEEKAQPYPKSPSGMPGVQTMLPVLLQFLRESLIDLPTLVRMTSARPAELYGITCKGKMEVGYDADVAVVDLDAEWTFERSMVQSKCGWSPYEGAKFVGRPIHTLIRGQFAVREGAAGHGSLGEPVRFDWKQSHA